MRDTVKGIALGYLIAPAVIVGSSLVEEGGPRRFARAVWTGTPVDRAQNVVALLALLPLWPWFILHVLKEAHGTDALLPDDETVPGRPGEHP